VENRNDQPSVADSKQYHSAIPCLSYQPYRPGRLGSAPTEDRFRKSELPQIQSSVAKSVLEPLIIPLRHIYPLEREWVSNACVIISKQSGHNLIILDLYPPRPGVNNVIANMHIEHFAKTNVSVLVQLDGECLATFQRNRSLGNPFDIDQVS